MTRSRLDVRFALALLLALPAPRLAHAQDTTHTRRHEIIRGRVLTDSGKPLPGAQIIATRAPDRQFKSDTTDSTGRFSIDWPDGTGDYLLHIAAVGYETFRKRVTRSGDDSVFVVDVRLAAEAKVQTLPTVVTQARRPKPQRSDAFGSILPGVGSDDQFGSGLSGALPPDLAGDLAAIAGTIPGVLSTAGGPSVLGLGASQNSTTLNGMAFGGADVPRDARTRVRVSSSSYDPANGWFGGARTNVELAPGGQFTSSRSHFTLDAPPVQYTDPISRQLGQQFTNLQGSVGSDGELAEDTWFYNYGLQGGRRSADLSSLLSANDDLLRHSGVSPDSAARFEQLLQNAGVPLTVGGIPGSQTTDNVSFLGRVDHAPYDWKTLQPAKTTYGLTGYGKYSNAQALAFSPTATPAHAGEQSQKIGMLQGVWSTYFGHDYLADVRSGFTYAHTRAAPYAVLPDAQVLVASDFPDGSGGINTLQFGGNGAFQSDTRRRTWESTAQLQLYPRGVNTHRLKVDADLRYDAYTDDIVGNRLGTFAYNSLADLAANTPASFTRTLNAPTREGGAWNAFASAGDLWRVNQQLQVMYGARVEGNAFVSPAANNPAVEQTFGVRTDYAPDRVHVSPRLGFTWIAGGQNRTLMMVSQMGSFTGGPVGVLRGGVGEFRSLIPPTLLGGPSVATGLPGSLSRLSCLGASAPAADWAAYVADPSAVPSTCAGGTPIFADSSPGVQLISRAYDAPHNWRGNLAWSSRWHKVLYTAQGIYSLNLGQPGMVDLNFADTPRFTVGDEGRPVFADATSIVPSTGTVSPVDARRSSSFGRVVSIGSDNRSTSEQLMLLLSPDLSAFRSPFYLSFAYTLGRSRQLQGGFDGSTFATPTGREWARGDLDVRHQFVLQTGYSRHGVTASLLGHLQSGLPYTPMVGSDVNGDGLANDRAFVFDPATVADPAVAAGLRSLLASGPANVRDCLRGQLGAAAGRASCEGPWTAGLNARLDVSGRDLGLGQRVNVSLNLANPLGGLDQLFHGSDNLHGWGTPATPDPVLYSVKGFDATARTFQYAVNPRFGSTSPTVNTIRAPFRLTLDVSVDVGRPIPVQQLDKWLKPGRGGRQGPKLNADDLMRRYSRDVPNPYSEVLQQSDSLLLTRDQVEAVQKEQQQYRTHMDSIWTDLANYLANLPDRFDAAAALKRSEAATDSAWEYSRHSVQKDFQQTLTPVQLRLLPTIAGLLYNAKEPLHIRIFIAGT